MDRNERDASMVARYSDGETLEAIGDDFGLTRERVRQIVKERGGVGAEEARAQRARVRELEKDARNAALLARFGGTALSMARAGSTRARAVARIALLHPGTDPEELDRAFIASSIPFKKADHADRFSEEALEAGVLCVLAGSLGLPPDRERAATVLTDTLVDEVVSVLREADISAEERADILGLIAAGRHRADTVEGTTITANQYDELRDELVSTLGLVSMQGASPWPPTKQTVSTRFGSWNQALRGFGLATSTRGRAMGLVVYSDQDYRAAVIEFVARCIAEGERSTHARYEHWARDEAAAGRRRPSSAAVRNYFGSWHGAVLAGNRVEGE